MPSHRGDPTPGASGGRVLQPGVLPLQCLDRDARAASDLSFAVGFGSVAAGKA